jgi:hypothetical protein
MKKALFFTASFLVLLSSGFHAQAARIVDSFEEGESFSKNSRIADTELDEKRGGFMNINGMLVNFAFNGVATINGNIVSQIQVDMAGVISAANGNPSNFLQPTVIQNVDNNALIAVQQTLNIQVSNAQQVMGNNNQFTQSAFQNAFMFR